MIDEAAEGVTEVAVMLGIAGGGGGGGMAPAFPDIPNNLEEQNGFMACRKHSSYSSPFLFTC